MICGETSLDAGERYYALIFGAQRIPPNPNYAHTFAVFVRVCDSPSGDILNYHTISWLPDNGVVRVRHLFAEKGRNFELHETIRWALDNGERVSMWGPYEIRKSIYNKSLKQLRRLKGRRVRYKALDSLRYDLRVTNCIHAVSALTGFSRLRVASPSWGETASWYIALRFLPWTINPKVKHRWIASALELDQYPIIHRDLSPPRSGLIWTFIKRKLHIPTKQVN